MMTLRHESKAVIRICSQVYKSLNEKNIAFISMFKLFGNRALVPIDTKVVLYIFTAKLNKNQLSVMS